MDDMTTFEHQIGDELRREIGPVPPFDARVIVRSATTTTTTGRWTVITRRLRGDITSARAEGDYSMFSALKFVAAAAIVALFGGFLLAGVLTTLRCSPCATSWASTPTNWHSRRASARRAPVAASSGC